MCPSVTLLSNPKHTFFHFFFSVLLSSFCVSTFLLLQIRRAVLLCALIILGCLTLVFMVFWMNTLTTVWFLFLTVVFLYHFLRLFLLWILTFSMIVSIVYTQISNILCYMFFFGLQNNASATLSYSVLIHGTSIVFGL